MKKDERGVTLIALTVTIIVLIILASVGLTSGISTINSSKLTKFTTEMKAIQVNVNELYNSWKIGETVTADKNYTGDEILNIGKDILSAQEAVDKVFKTELEGGSGITNTEGYRYFDSEMVNLLGNQKIKQDFFVNIKKRSVISVKGIQNKGKMCYTLEQLPDGLYNVEYLPIENIAVEFDISGEYLSKDKGRIDVYNITYSGQIDKWQLRYRIKGENNWKITSEFKGKDFEIEVNKLGIYEVQLFHGKEVISDIKEIAIQQ